MEESGFKEEEVLVVMISEVASSSDSVALSSLLRICTRSLMRRCAVRKAARLGELIFWLWWKAREEIVLLPAKVGGGGSS